MSDKKKGIGKKSKTLFSNMLIRTRPYLFLRAAHQKDILLGQFKSGTQHGLEEGFVLIAPEAGYFTGRRHLDAKNGIGAPQTREGELRDFDSHVRQLGFVTGHLRHFNAAEDVGGVGDKVNAKDLG